MTGFRKRNIRKKAADDDDGDDPQAVQVPIVAPPSAKAPQKPSIGAKLAGLQPKVRASVAE